MFREFVESCAMRNVCIEGLEDRRLFAVTAALGADGGVIVTGDAQANNITIVKTPTQTTVKVVGAKDKVFKIGDKSVRVNAGDGADTVTVTQTGLAASSTLTRVDAGAGPDTVSVTTDGGTVIVLGGIGNDELTLNNGNSPNANGHMVLGDGGDDVIKRFGFVYCQIQGGTGMDTITGGAGPDEIYGGDGDDDISGGDGDDTLSGEEGNDTLRGGNGNDVLCVSNGVDEIYGQAGNDIFYQIPVTVNAWSLLDGGDDDNILYFNPAGGPASIQGHMIVNIGTVLPNPYQ